jgi:cell fate regulator YaaT (PSP1 superfamily)
MYRRQWLFLLLLRALKNLYRKNERRGYSYMENQPIEILQFSFKARRLALFANRTSKPVDMDAMAVVSVDRGEDIGRVVAKLPVNESNIELVEGDFLRLPSEQDIENFKANAVFEAEVLDYCRKRVKIRNLDMRLSDCETQLDRNRIRIFFTADQRTDFRGLVRDMASAFRARIEMRQIGVRDDAKYKDGVGICGRQLCCAGFLNEFKSVTLKSVRDQHLSPNPSKVSGACSRLMCCLEYETEFYNHALKTCPREGLKLKVNGAPACVKQCDIFRETVTLLWEGTGEEEMMEIEDFHRRRTMLTPMPEVEPPALSPEIPDSEPPDTEEQESDGEASDKPEIIKSRSRFRKRKNRKEERKS